MAFNELSELQLVVFDVDDVLVDTSRAEFKAAEAALARIGLTEYTESAHTMWRDISIALPNMGVRPALTLLGAELELALSAETLVEAEQTYWDRYWQSLQPVDGAMDLIHSISSQAVQVGVCGNGTSTEQRRKLAAAGYSQTLAHGLAKFRPNTSAYALPNTFMLRHIRESVGLPPEHCLFVTCDLAGVLGANIDGWHSVLLDWDLILESKAEFMQLDTREAATELVKLAESDFTINSLDELAALPFNDDDSNSRHTGNR